MSSASLSAIPLTPRQVFDLRCVCRFVRDLCWNHYPQHAGAADDLGDILDAAVLTSQSVLILRDVRSHLDRIPRTAYIERKYVVAVLDDLLLSVTA